MHRAISEKTTWNTKDTNIDYSNLKDGQKILGYFKESGFMFIAEWNKKAKEWDFSNVINGGQIDSFAETPDFWLKIDTPKEEIEKLKDKIQTRLDFVKTLDIDTPDSIQCCRHGVGMSLRLLKKDYPRIARKIEMINQEYKNKASLIFEEEIKDIEIQLKLIEEKNGIIK